MNSYQWVVGAAMVIAPTVFCVNPAPAQVVRDWVAEYPGLRAVAVAADAAPSASAAIYVAGTSPLDEAHNFRSDIVLLKYSLEGELIWAREFDELDDAT